MTDEQLDELHRIKRMLTRQNGRRVTIEELLQEGVRLVLRHYQSVDDTRAAGVQA
jgi:hypothetical protein